MRSVRLDTVKQELASGWVLQARGRRTLLLLTYEEDKHRY